MKITPQACHKSSLMLNEYATKLSGASASFHVHYWGGKPEHYGNVSHAHHFFEICYVVEGVGSYIHDGVAYDLHQGTLYCSKPGKKHYFQSEEGLLLLFVAFEMMEEDATDEMVQIWKQLQLCDHLFSPNMQMSPPVWLWTSLIWQAAESEVVLIPSIEQLAHHLLMTLLSHFGKHPYIRAHPSHSDQNVQLTANVRSIRQHVLSDVSKKWTLRGVSQLLHISERQCSRIFAEELGLTFPQWLRIERIKKAAYLLAFTDLVMEDVAEQTGFESIHYFNRIFQETLKLPPGQFRKKMQSSKLDASMIHHYLDTIVQPHKKG